MAGGLTGGDYLRVSAGVTSPLHPQGTLREWDRGNAVSLVWENWGSGSRDVSLSGFGLSMDYARLPLNAPQFLSDFRTPTGGAAATSASGSSAQVFSIAANLRVRIPSPYVMPFVNAGFGFLSFQPGTVTYTSNGSTSTTSQQRRTGATFNISTGVDRQIAGRTAIFGEATYTYAFTGLAQGLPTPGGACTQSGCDVLKNTTLGAFRAGLRVHLGQ